MRRLILVLVAVLWIVPAFSQEITGTWVISENHDGSKEKGKDHLQMIFSTTEEQTFSSDASFNESGQTKILLGQNDISYSMTITYSGGGTWKREGDLLTLQYNPKLAKAKLTETNVPVVFRPLLTSTITRELKKQMKASKPETSRILSLTATELKLQDPEHPKDVVTYRRK